MKEIPYDELDANIVELVRVFNSFPGIYTVGSCGGHANPESYQSPEGSWDIVFVVEVDDSRPTRDGWLSLEFLVYAFNNWFYRSGLKVFIGPYSAPPHFNEPGNTMTFRAAGPENPSEIARQLLEMKQGCFVVDNESTTQ